MESKAILKNLGISPKKVRIPAEVVRGMSVVEALTTLRFMRKSAAADLAKVIKSAASNAMNRFSANPENLLISEIRVDKGGRRIKHYHPRAKGGGYYVWERGKSHITVVLKDSSKKEVVEDKKNLEDSKEDLVEKKGEKIKGVDTEYTKSQTDVNIANIQLIELS